MSLKVRFKFDFENYFNENKPDISMWCDLSKYSDITPIQIFLMALVTVSMIIFNLTTKCNHCQSFRDWGGGEYQIFFTVRDQII